MSPGQFSVAPLFFKRELLLLPLRIIVLSQSKIKLYIGTYGNVYEIPPTAIGRDSIAQFDVGAWFLNHCWKINMLDYLLSN